MCREEGQRTQRCSYIEEKKERGREEGVRKRQLKCFTPFRLPVVPPLPLFYSLEQLGQVLSLQGRRGWWQLVEDFH